MVKQNFRPTKSGVFSGAKIFIENVEVLKKTVGQTFCPAMKKNRRVVQETEATRQKMEVFVFRG
jgi:hypothetical protein